jgi:D-xylose 1-dehydrogenase
VPDPIQAHHIAAMVLFPASEDAAACTAQEFVVDAGWT